MSAAITAAVIGVVGSAVVANQQKQAAKGAAGAQVAAAQSGISEQQRQFDAIRALLAPYAQGGTGAFNAQQQMLGLQGADAQAQMMAELEKSPAFTAISKQGENAILQNAAATGGLRGGNTQAALSQFRPQLLNQLFEQRFGQLGQLSQMGQAAAAGQASAGLQTGTNIANLFGGIGQAQAGQSLANAAANAGLINAFSKFGGDLTGILNKPPTNTNTGRPVA